MYDIRNVSRSLAVMESKLSTFRSLRFTPDGEYLVGAEDVDFVHIYSTKDNFQKAQVIDFFGILLFIIIMIFYFYFIFF